MITIILGDTKRKLPFYVTNLGRDQIILGMTWFRALKLEINWEKETLSKPMALRTANVEAQINQTTVAMD